MAAPESSFSASSTTITMGVPGNIALSADISLAAAVGLENRALLTTARWKGDGADFLNFRRIVIGS